ncbi:hypothetical protein ACS0TY_014119 [Phlomoides rotata]
MQTQCSVVSLAARRTPPLSLKPRRRSDRAQAATNRRRFLPSDESPSRRRLSLSPKPRRLELRCAVPSTRPFKIFVLLHGRSSVSLILQVRDVAGEVMVITFDILSCCDLNLCIIMAPEI